MKREPVQSATLEWIAYDAARQVLEVAFHKGGVYRFFDVPEFLYRGLKLARSKGQFYNRNIEDRYRYEEINDEPT